MIRPERGGIRLDADQRMLIRTMARFRSTMGVFSRGYGKCVSGDTIINTNLGYIEIGELFNYQQDRVETEFDLDLEILNRFGELENSNAGVYSGFKPTKKIRTNEGYNIETTLVHPLLVVGDSGELVWKKAKDIKIGDYLPIQRNNKAYGNKVDLSSCTKRAEQYLKSSFSSNSQQKIEKKDFIPAKVLTKELSLLLGHLVEKGDITKDNYFTLRTKDSEVLKNAKKVLGKMGLVPVAKTDVDYVVYGTVPRVWFRELGLKQYNSYESRVPTTIMKSTKENIRYFLRGLFDAKGRIDSRHIEYYTTSDKMANEVQVLLLGFGIVSKVNKEYSKKYNRLIISGQNVALFQQEIGFSIIGKNESLSNICDTEECSNIGKAPDIEKDLSSQNYFYSQIIEIESSKEHVYDIQVPETNSFTGNGIINHNTMIQLMSNYHTAVWFPDTNLVMTAQTKENASNLIGEKYNEIKKFFPLLMDELSREPRISKDKAEVFFKSGSQLDTLANAQSSKGARRHRITIEESAQVSQFTFEDVLEPVVNTPRRTLGAMAIVNPYELNGQINRFTTSWYKGKIAL